MKLKIGIIGAGRIGYRHILAYEKISNAKVIGISDSNSANSEFFTKKFNIKKFDIDSIHDEKSIDAIHICTPNEFHSKLAISAMKHGKHVLVEKPMATNLDDCKKMISIAKKAGVKLMIGHTYRYYPSTLAIKKILELKKIGRPISGLDYLLTTTKLIPKNKLPIYGNKNRFDNPIIMDSIHLVDKFRFLLNSEIDYIYTSKIDKIEKSSKVDQIGNITILFKNNFSLNLLIVGNPGNLFESDTKIIGDKGIISAKYGEEVKYGNSNWKGISFKYKSSPPSFEHNLEGFVNEFKDFLYSIENDSEPAVSGLDGMNNLKAVLSMYESYEKRGVVKL